MPFVKIERRRFLDTSTAHPISMAIYKADGKKVKIRSVVIRITEEFYKQVWPNATDDRVRIAVLEGTGKDAGFLQLQLDEHGYTGSSVLSGQTVVARAISIASQRFKYYILNDTEAPMDPVQFVVDGNTVLIECPSWLVFNQLTAPDEPEPPKPVTPPPPSWQTKPVHAEMKRPRGRPPKAGYHHS